MKPAAAIATLVTLLLLAIEMLELGEEQTTAIDALYSRLPAPNGESQ